MSNNKKQYDWATIQSYYDLGHSIRDVVQEFGCASLTVQRATKQGLFVPRGKNEKRKSTALVSGGCLKCGVEVKTSRSKFCSNTCYAADYRETYIARWIVGLETGSDTNGDLKGFCREDVVDRAGNACQECGCAKANPFSGRPVAEVDHIDGDASNNEVSNLRVLCPTCHAMTENYGSLNRGKGRHHRRLAYAKQKQDIAEYTINR